MDPKVAGELLAVFLACIVALLAVIAALARKELKRLVEIVDRIPDKAWFERITNIVERASVELVEYRIRLEHLEQEARCSLREGK